MFGIIQLMSGKRTRKQKENVHHNFTISWSNEPKKTVSKALVNTQFKSALNTNNNEDKISNRADNMAIDYDLVAIKRNIIKSLIIISFILALEVVIYLVWQV